MLDYNKWRMENGLPPLASRVKREKKSVTSVLLSEEATAGLREIANHHKITFGNKTSLSRLLELIGTYNLSVVAPQEATDLKSNLTTDDCHTAGKEDAKEKLGVRFNTLYPEEIFANDVSRRLMFEAYVRGYIAQRLENNMEAP